MPIDVEYRVNTKALRNLQTQIGRIPRALERAVRVVILPKVEAYALPRLQYQPPQSPLPFIWSYDPVKQARARRWYFANKVPRGSKGGRYQRTGRLRAGWMIAYNPLTGTMRMQNKAAGAEYVQGERQVPSHRTSGWITTRSVRTGAANIARAELRKLWRELTGVRR